MFTTPECIKTPVDLVKLWLHEASRVYGDKLIEIKDMENFQKMKLDIAKAGFEASLNNMYYVITFLKMMSSIYRSNIVHFPVYLGSYVCKGSSILLCN